MYSYINVNKRLAKRYEEWMIAMHYVAETRSHNLRTIRLFIEFLGPKSITGVTHLEIRQFITRVSLEGASWVVTYRHLGVLRVFYDFLNLGGVVSYVAPRLVKLRRPKTALPPILSEEQVQKLIAATQTLRERALIETFYATGCRLREIRHLRVGEVDLAAKTARVTGKFGKVRIALLTASAVEALRAYIGDRQDGFIFREDLPSQKGSFLANQGYWMGCWTAYHRRNGTRIERKRCFGRIDVVPREEARRRFDNTLKHVNLSRPQPRRPLSNMAVQQALKRIGNRVGLKNVGPHMLRRSFATHLYDHGAPAEVIQALMGHVFLQTTMEYTRLSVGRLVKTFEQCHPRDQMHG